MCSSDLKRRLDLDNVWGGCKSLVDSLRDVGLIRNDSPRWCDLGIVECRTKDHAPGVLVEWEPVDEGRSNSARVQKP